MYFSSLPVAPSSCSSPRGHNLQSTSSFLRRARVGTCWFQLLPVVISSFRASKSFAQSTSYKMSFPRHPQIICDASRCVFSKAALVRCQPERSNDTASVVIVKRRMGRDMPGAFQVLHGPTEFAPGFLSYFLLMSHDFSEGCCLRRTSTELEACSANSTLRASPKNLPDYLFRTPLVWHTVQRALKRRSSRTAWTDRTQTTLASTWVLVLSNFTHC